MVIKKKIAIDWNLRMGLSVSHCQAAEKEKIDGSAVYPTVKQIGKQIGTSTKASTNGSRRSVGFPKA